MKPTTAAHAIPSIRMIGVHMHIGSQITTTEPDASARGVERMGQLRAMRNPIDWYNMGGGYGITCKRHDAPPVGEFAPAIAPAVNASGVRLASEPGRVIARNAGILLSRVLYTKQAGNWRFVIQDAAMNDRIRPALDESYHRIRPGSEPSDVVGAIGESGDFRARDRPIAGLDRGALLATFFAGACARVMAPNDNTRPRAAEVLVDGQNARLVRRRETDDDLLRPEVELSTNRTVVGPGRASAARRALARD